VSGEAEEISFLKEAEETKLLERKEPAWFVNSQKKVHNNKIMKAATFWSHSW
jgi:hypothetical protein